MKATAGWLLCLLVLGELLLAGSLKDAQALLKAGRWEEAITAIENLPPDAAGSVDATCGLAEAHRILGSHGKSIEAARSCIVAAREDVEKARARYELGRSLRAKGKKKLFPEAIEQFRRAAELDPRLTIARLLLAETLLYQKKLDAAKTVLEQLAINEPSSAVGVRSAALLRNPENVALPSLPAFSISTMDGKVLSGDELLGEVVILDFWATWCGPCVAALPDLAEFHNSATGRPLRLVSISVDEDVDVLRDFVAEREMNWSMIHDGRGILQRYFGVRSFPTYFLVDPDGFILERASGFTESSRGPVNRLLMQAKQLAEEMGSR